jgi:hypothetical protein
MKNSKKIAFSVLFSLGLLFAPVLVTPGGSVQASGTLWDAQEPAVTGNRGQLARTFGSSATPDLRVMIARFIKVFLGLLGIVFVILLILAGWQLMTAQGSSDAIGKATDKIKTAVIGLVIIVSAYALTNFIINQITGAASGEPTIWFN